MGEMFYSKIIQKRILKNCFLFEQKNPNQFQFIRFIISDVWKKYDFLSTYIIDNELRKLIENNSLIYLFNDSEMVRYNINKNLSLDQFYKASIDTYNDLITYEEALNATIRLHKTPFNINDKVMETKYFITGIVKSFEIINNTVFALVDFDVEVILININYLKKVE